MRTIESVLEMIKHVQDMIQAQDGSEDSYENYKIQRSYLLSSDKFQAKIGTLNQNESSTFQAALGLYKVYKYQLSSRPQYDSFKSYCKLKASTSLLERPPLTILTSVSCTLE